MANKFEIYKCDICGVVIQILEQGNAKLVCCEKIMNKVVENTTDAAKEKHIPIVEKSKNKIKIKVGNLVHPMEQSHYIQWIELVTGTGTFIKFLSHTDRPEVIFNLECDDFYVRAYCNLHGLWKN